MFPEKFEYYAPESIEEATKFLNGHEDAKVLAGGQSLIPLLKLRFTSIPQLVDIGRLKGMDSISFQGNTLRIGPMARTHSIAEDPQIRKKFPILSEAAGLIADPLVRNMGTIGGDICHGDPANDFPAVMLALNATFEVTSAKGKRTIKAQDFFTDTFTTALNPGEILTGITIEDRNSSGRYMKYKKYAGDFSILGIAVNLSMDSGKIKEAGIGLTNCGATALKATEAEKFLVGKEVTDDNIAKAGDLLLKAADFMDDDNGSVKFKEKLLKYLFTKAVKGIGGVPK
ncbi:FAD binding domain-containing protein [Ferroplasma acidiphilum]|uniref:Carbon monoxide dehydrogenase, medium chain n=1 Tax=Ferroplasma acidiphilum TaxID=74969 RepID=A0A1V0N388_9ARCH|nr:xanthine dehydrogenase family protein subunit M [Ferroplasma acidiphilum]ARD84561.1 carbon monoxide dehydrogenase, medium chain [Ferroplasma acidiphilum]NOL59925.1 xanthine dehydrogenase family protein subunit M [Ferroplasma acidiphilum]